MTDIKDFRKTNGLTQATLAQYLGVSEPFISRVESGRDSLPQDKLERLISNQEGWNVDMLLRAPESPVMGSAPANRPASNRTMDQLRIEQLTRRVAELEEQNREYWELIKKLTDQK